MSAPAHIATHEPRSGIKLGRVTELHELTAVDQARAVRDRTVSPVELVEHHLDRIEALDGTLGAFVTVTADAAMDAARAAEKLVAAADSAADLPPLLGVPTAIKDLNLTAGVRTTFGSVLYQDFVPPVDDDVVRLLREAGTISLGKTATPEFGLPCYTEPAGRPPTVTPWDTGRLAGGSSGGSAAAVAAGLVPFAQASDGGGSIRIPASVCGLVGLKPSRGRVSRGPIASDVTMLSVLGPMVRTVADAAAMLDVISAGQLGEPYWAPTLPAGETFASHVGREPGVLRVGRYAQPPVPGVEVDPECLAAWEAASALLASLGHDVQDVQVPFGDHVVPVFEVVWAVASHSYPIDPARESELMPLTRWWRSRGSAASGPDFLRAMQTLQSVAREAVLAHAAYDIVLTPTVAMPPRPVGWFTEGGDPAQDFERQKAFTPFTAVYNVTGQPAMSLPLHWSADGLPIGVQLVGRPGAEATLIAVGSQLEAAQPWSHRRPVDQPR
jgi:amidase